MRIISPTSLSLPTRGSILPCITSSLRLVQYALMLPFLPFFFLLPGMLPKMSSISPIDSLIFFIIFSKFSGVASIILIFLPPIFLMSFILLNIISVLELPIRSSSSSIDLRNVPYVIPALLNTFLILLASLSIFKIARKTWQVFISSEFISLAISFAISKTNTKELEIIAFLFGFTAESVFEETT